MSDTGQQRMFHFIERVGTEKLTEYARRLVTGDLMVADLNDRDWQTSLGLILAAWAEDETKVPGNLGKILVPVGPHMGGYWLNGRVPGFTHQIICVAQEDMEELRAIYEPMINALYPGTEQP